MSATVEMSTLLETIKDLETRLSGLRKMVESGTKTKKPKKERDPDAPKREPNDWIKFTQRVDGLLKTADKSFKRVADSKKFAAHLKKVKVYAEWADDAILAERETWTPPPPEEKDGASVGSADVPTEVVSAPKPGPVPDSAAAGSAAAGGGDESGSETEGKKKPGRKPMTEEQKAAAKAEREKKAATMTAEEKEAAAAKKAEAAAKRKAKKEAAE